jgi:hypothetical protein
LAASDKSEILAKLDAGELKVKGPDGRVVQSKPKSKASKRSIVQEEGAIHQQDSEHAGSDKPDESKATEKPKVAEFPIKGTINKYGFIGVSVGLCNALNLPVAQKGQKSKLSKNVEIEFSSYDPETRTLKLKIL